MRAQRRSGDAGNKLTGAQINLVNCLADFCCYPKPFSVGADQTSVGGAVWQKLYRIKRLEIVKIDDCYCMTAIFTCADVIAHVGVATVWRSADFMRSLTGRDGSFNLVRSGVNNCQSRITLIDDQKVIGLRRRFKTKQ